MVRVTVSEGTLEGEFVENEYGGTYYSFKGIPYAEPPVGDLRFKSPQPPIPWEGIRSAKDFAKVCFQGNQKGTTRGSEDCLYLNVYTPSIEPDEPWPVMFWIHGGSFYEGSGNDYLFGPEFLIRHGVIFVTCNYRLGALGFLCLHTEEIPGNAGMKDQVSALRWVKKNIRSFGGDPENVTIFGNSAGAACVCLHLASPITKGLFKKAIAPSGCSTSWWAHTFDPREKALALAKKLGFRSGNDQHLSNFFKELTVQSLIEADVPLNIGNNASRTNVFAHIQYAIVSERNFANTEPYFQGDVYDLQANVIHEGVEVMIGYNADEGVCIIPKENEYDRFTCDINSYQELLVPTLIYKNCLISQQLDIGMKMKKFYFGNNRVTKENWEQLYKYFSMETFVYDIMQWVKFYCSNKVYLYKFSCISERNIMSSRHGLFSSTRNKEVATHADELGYMFNARVMDNIDKCSEAYQMIGNVTKLLTNFAKYGDPTPENSLGVKWLPYTVEKQDYLEISRELIPKTEPEMKELSFWEDVYREYGPKYVYKPRLWHMTTLDECRAENKIS